MIEYVVAACNAEAVIGTTLDLISERWGQDPEQVVLVTVVVNNTTDDTATVVRRKAAELSGPRFEVRELASPAGLGAALRRGVAASVGDTLVLTADDLPFDHSDLDAWIRLGRPPVMIGSKAHRDSVVHRSVARSVLSSGFKVLRWVVLSSQIGDPQGTIVVEGGLAREFVVGTRERGYVWTTEFLHRLEKGGHRPVEAPVQLSSRHASHGTRIRVRDVWGMASGTVRIARAGSGMKPRLGGH